MYKKNRESHSNSDFHDMDDSITTFGRIRIINSENLGDSYDFINWH